MAGEVFRVLELGLGFFELRVESDGMISVRRRRLLNGGELR